ncbi:Glutaconyl-CoA decarboxylase subunit gamma [Desulfosarcina cetonica]|nr:Glutaconyl-CoA decarboxylase subunit gamma [Desulfosarcina cetonica]
MQYHLTIQDKQYSVEIGTIENGSVTVSVNDEVYQVDVDHLDQYLPDPATARPQPATRAASPVPAVSRPTPVPAAPTSAAMPPAGEGVVTAPIPGLILEVKVQVGDTVSSGQTVATMEAMKMENNICSTVSGTVKEIRAAKGAAVAAGDVIMAIG